jgi:hypothetical protein
MAYYHLGRMDRNQNAHELSIRIPDIVPTTLSWVVLEGIMAAYLLFRRR